MTSTMKKHYQVWGTIEEVYDDLGPCTRVRILCPDGGTMSFDLADLAFDKATLKANVGKTLTIRTECTIE